MLGRSAAGRAELAIIDGYEQLSLWNQFWLRLFCWRRGCGLLVTTHKPTGLPILCRANVTRETALRVAHLLLDGQPECVDDFEVVAPLAAHRGNLREALFDLYDLYEQRRRRAPSVG